MVTSHYQVLATLTWCCCVCLLVFFTFISQKVESTGRSLRSWSSGTLSCLLLTLRTPHELQDVDRVCFVCFNKVVHFFRKSFREPKLQRVASSLPRKRMKLFGISRFPFSVSFVDLMALCAPPIRKNKRTALERSQNFIRDGLFNATNLFGRLYLEERPLTGERDTIPLLEL